MILKDLFDNCLIIDPEFVLSAFNDHETVNVLFTYKHSYYFDKHGDRIFSDTLKSYLNCEVAYLTNDFRNHCLKVAIKI